MLRRAHAKTQSRQSLNCSHVKEWGVGESSAEIKYLALPDTVKNRKYELRFSEMLANSKQIWDTLKRSIHYLF